MADIGQQLIPDTLDVPFKEFTAGQIIQSKHFNDDVIEIEDKVNEIIAKYNIVTNSYKEHVQNYLNPHQVDAHQVGTYTSEELDAFILDLKNGGFNDNSILNNVLADGCINTRNISEGSITASKIEPLFGSQVDISQNMNIINRYTKLETDTLVQSKVGDGTYDKETIDEKLSQVQAGAIVDKSIGIEKFKDSVGEFIELSANPQIKGRYTITQVNELIKSNCAPKDWGNIIDEIEDGNIEFPVSPPVIFNTAVVDYSKVGKSVLATCQSRLVNGHWVEGEIISSVDLNTMVDNTSENTARINTLDTDLNSVRTSLSLYQQKTDNTLTTTSKTVIGAINELKLKDDSFASQISAINTKNNSQDSKIATLESYNTSFRLSTLEGINAGTRLTAIEAKNTSQDTLISNQANSISAIQTKNTEQDGKITSIEILNNTQDTKLTDLETLNNAQNTRLTNVESKNTLQDDKIVTIESKDVEQDTRLDKVETTNTTQNTRLDKIEYQNKVQDTYISGLFNENGDKRLSIEGEGNDLKLEGSKEGLAQVDKVVGNTVVNYCTGGDRELTLNGDIEVEGTNVTITESVDNGLVDVVCEGNTLVNLIKRKTKQFVSSPSIILENCSLASNSTVLNINLPNPILNYNVSWCYCGLGHPNIDMIKPNTIYTIITDNITDCIRHINIQNNNALNKIAIFKNKVNKNTFVVQSVDDFSNLNLKDNDVLLYTSFEPNYTGQDKVEDVLLLEGDYTNKPIPSEYFEGMKSVGQDDVNGHKVEITSRNKNLFDGELEGGDIKYTNGNLENNVSVNRSVNYIKVTPGRNMYFNHDGTTTTISIRCYDEYKNYTMVALTNGAKIPSNVYYIKFVVTNKDTNNIQIEENTIATPYTPPLSNTLSIPLSAPLRGLPSGVKDRFVKREGKWYVERNCGKVVLNGNTNEIIGVWGTDASINTKGFYIDTAIKNENSSITAKKIICDRFICYSRGGDSNLPGLDAEGICDSQTVGKILFKISTSKLLTQDVTGFKQWLQANPTTVIYQLVTPTYEPLNLSPELITYLETTHISNNSIIPCNMSIKNTGYSAIIKPSTLYTVIADKNTTGTLGVNLGGTKATTLTNKVTVTTPATLTDNMLRLSGKGLKGSKVRLLEGDETTLSYPYFEGLKSSFEEGLVTQEMVSAGTEKVENLGKYKASVKVRGKNLISKEYFAKQLLTMPNITRINFDGKDCLKITGTLGFKTVKLYESTYMKTMIINLYTDSSDTSSICKYGNYLSPSSNSWRKNTSSSSDNTVDIYNYQNRNIYIDLDSFQLEEGTLATSYEPYFERTETVYLNSPLLKGDELVVKEDGLYHLHKMGKVVLNGSENWSLRSTDVATLRLATALNGLSLSTDGNYQYFVICDKFMNHGFTKLYNEDYEGIAKVNSVSEISIRISKIKLSTQDVTGFKAWLQTNPVTIVYELAEPYYEKISDYPITLECTTTSSLSVDSLIPCATLKATYTGSVPSVYSLENTGIQNTEDINDTQIAVDYLLMSNMSTMAMNLGLTMKGVNTMGAYFASRIMRGFLDYDAVVAKYPEFKDDIDFILRSEGREDLITK